MLLQQNPIVVEVTRQPTPTPEISYVGILGAAGMMAIAIFAVAFLIGGVIGGIIIWRKKQAERSADVDGPSHVRLKLG
jgi:uncharacterized Tic20 family protein